jgi:hypothetical protein
MDSISIELDIEEIEILWNFVCEEIEFQNMDFDQTVYNKLNWLKVKLALKKNMLEGD